MALIGNTIKITGSFVNDLGVKVDATEVTIEIYGGSTLIETIELTELDQDDLGRYVKKYIVPDGTGDLKLKMFGIVDGYPQVGSAIIKRTKF